MALLKIQTAKTEMEFCENISDSGYQLYMNFYGQTANTFHGNVSVGSKGQEISATARINE